jgi:fatty acid amide hydrolase 2
MAHKSDFLLTMGAFELAGKVRSGDVSSLELVEAHIQRVLDINPRVNAMTEDRFEDARREARAADNPKDTKRLAKPLLGVPFTIKEMIAVEGMKSTQGSIHRKDNVQKRDATVVARFREAGAILIGTSNVPEVGFWFECSNVIYGRTNNPYDLSRTCGGSSGGEAALIASGASAFGAGSDIGGSIRMPAFFCGIFGHKTSNGLVPFTGHSPMYFNNAKDLVGNKHPLTTLGPMARRATDLAPLLSLMIGPDGFDPEVIPDFKLKPTPKFWKGLKVYTLPSPRIHGTTETEPEISEVVTQTGRFFEQLGAQVIELDEKIFLSSFRLWVAAMSSIEGRDFNTTLNPNGPIAFKKEFFKIATGRGDYTFPALLTAYLEITKFDELSNGPALEELENLRQHLQDLLMDDGILLMPPHPRIAPHHGAPIITPFDFSYTGIANALRLPASSAPIGQSASGLPLGVQIIANEFQDHLCLAACVALESAFGGWKMAEPV